MVETKDELKVGVWDGKRAAQMAASTVGPSVGWWDEPMAASMVEWSV